MKVLLAVGGSEDAARALERTLERAAEAGDDLTVAVIDDPDTERDPAEAERLVEAELADSPVDAELRRLEDDPGSRLVDLAEREGFDEVVLGGGRTSPMGKIRIGTVAEFVLLNSHTTVTLVR